MLSLSLFCGSEKSRKIPAKFPCKKKKIKIHRRASAGVQGEHFKMISQKMSPNSDFWAQHFSTPISGHGGDDQERGSGRVWSTVISQSRDESQSVPSPGKLFETRDLELPFFEGSLPSCSPHSAGYNRTFLHPYFPVAKIRVQGRKNSININFLARISCGHFWPLRPNAQGSKSFSPPPGPQENARFRADVHDFRRGRPWPEGLSKNFVQKKFALIFWPLRVLFQVFQLSTKAAFS